MRPLGKRSQPPMPQLLPLPKASAADSIATKGGGRSGRGRHSAELRCWKKRRTSTLSVQSLRREEVGSATRIQMRLVLTGTLARSALVCNSKCRAESSLAPLLIAVPGGGVVKRSSSSRWEPMPAQKVGLTLTLVPRGLCISSYKEESQGLKVGIP